MVVQPVIEAQVRSVVTPGAVAWYCVEVHVVRLVHARLLVVVALAVSYSSLEEQVRWAAQSRFWA